MNSISRLAEGVPMPELANKIYTGVNEFVKSKAEAYQLKIILRTLGLDHSAFTPISVLNYGLWKISSIKLSFSASLANLYSQNNN